MSMFHLERSASDIEPFLDAMTRLAEKLIFQRLCIIVHQKFMVRFGSLGVRVSVLQSRCKGLCFAVYVGVRVSVWQSSCKGHCLAV
jgi:hypothetical protein